MESFLVQRHNNTVASVITNDTAQDCVVHKLKKKKPQHVCLITNIQNTSMYQIFDIVNIPYKTVKPIFKDHLIQRK